MANVTIREARPDDAEAVAGLLDQLGYPAPVDAVARRIERHRASSCDSLLIALRRGRVVGLATLHVSLALEYDGDAAKLSAIVVDAEHRRRGVGESLVTAVEAEARARGCVLLFLTTAEHRKDAHAFYRRLGFRETGRRFAKELAV